MRSGFHVCRIFFRKTGRHHRIKSGGRLSGKCSIDRFRPPEDNAAASDREATGDMAKRLRNLAWIGAAAICIASAPVMAEQRPQWSQSLTNFQPTIAEPPPGVDHGNTSDNLAEQFQRQAVFYRSQHPVGTIIIETARTPPLSDRERDARAALRHRRRPRRLHLVRACCRSRARPSGRTGPAAGDDRAPALSAALHGRRARQPARRPRDVSRQHRLSHPRHQRAGDDRQRRLLGLLPPGQRRRHRSLRSRPVGTKVIVRQN